MRPVSAAISLILLRICLLQNDAAGFQPPSVVFQCRRPPSSGMLMAADKEQGDGSTPFSSVDRKGFWMAVSAAFAAGVGVPTACEAKSYSQNAANLERINAGDFSGGAVFNNNPTTEGAKKRRAMTGCKTPIAREEAAQAILKQKSLGEKECNTMVMGGDTEFMLQALRNLDCKTCPNGIASSRPQ